MKSVSKEVRKKRITISIPETVYDRAVTAAQSGGQSLSAWLRFAISAYTKRWKIPAADVASAGLRCEHPACHKPAGECKRPAEHQKQGMWQ